MSEIHRPSGEDTPLKVVIVDISEHRRQLARDAADARLGDETAANYASRKDAFKDWRGFVARAWKGNLFKEYYQQKYYREELGNIDGRDNLYEHEGGDDQAAILTVVDRFSSDFDEAIHTDAGEARNIYGEEDNAPNNIRANIKDLIADFANGNLDEDSFEEEKNRVCALLANGDQDKIAGGLLYADNLLEIAQNVKAAAEHGQALEELLENMQIITGEAQMGARTEARFNKIDKIVDKLSSTRIGSLIPEAAIASAVAVASGFMKWGSQKALSMALAVTGVLGISGGVMGALRESKRIKQERALHMRERASGKEITPGSGRRHEMEATRYDTVGAQDLIAQLDTLYDGDSLRAMSSDEFMQATNQIAAIASRIRMSDVKKIDLIHFSSLDAIESERFALDLALAQAKVKMNQYLGAQVPDFLPAGLRVGDFNALLSGHLVAASAEIDRANEAKDDAFNTLKHKEVFKAARKAFGWGMLFGATAQEAMAHLPGNDMYSGLGEGHNGTERTTMLHALLQGREHTGADSASLVTTTTGDHSLVKVPDGYKVEASGSDYQVIDPTGKNVTTLHMGADGRFTQDTLDAVRSVKGAQYETTPGGRGVGLSGESKNIPVYDQFNQLHIPKEYTLHDISNGDGSGHTQLLDQNGKSIADFNLNPDGTLSPEAIKAIEGSGLKATDVVDRVGTQSTTTVATPEELLWNNAEQATAVRRTLWFGNDTSGVFDQNELRAHAGGVGGDWFDSNGNAVLDVTAMHPDGSYWHGSAVNPWESADKGQLYTNVSLSKGTQDMVFSFKVERTPDGRLLATIPQNSPAYQLFEHGNDHSGHGAFNGRYIEVAEMTGERDPNGALEAHMLATYVGENDAHDLTTIIDTTRDRHIATIGAPVVAEQALIFNPENTVIQEVTPITPIPIFTRKGMERLREQRRYGYNSYYSPESIHDLERDISPRLRQNPSAELSPAEELSWYRRQIRRRKGAQYADSIEQAIDDDPVLNGITNTTKAIVAIPVGAVSESENIYKTLAVYAKQQAEGLNASTILLHINWINDAEADPDKKAKIDKTLAEIERAKRDYPDLKIGSFTTVWDRDEVTRRGGVIGDVARKLYDTAMMCTERAIREGRMISTHDVLIIRNDADAQGMSRDYLGRMVHAADEKPDTDAFVGAVRWETDTHQDYPGFGIVTNFREIMHANSGRASQKSRIPTIGINTAIRASTFAAIGGVGYGSYVGAGSDDLEIGARLYTVRGGVVSGKRGRRYGRRSRRYATAETGPYSSTPIAYVRQAQIDSAAARLLKQYRLGRSITRTWDEFDRGGHSDRTAVDPSSAMIGPEGELGLDIESISGRIEHNISSMATDWFPDPRSVQTGLRFAMPEKVPSGRLKGETVYTVKWHGRNCTFEFTDAGKDWLKRSLERRSDGRIDPFGNRVRRKQYQEGTTKIKPKTVRPKMVTA